MKRRWPVDGRIGRVCGASDVTLRSEGKVVESAPGTRNVEVARMTEITKALPILVAYDIPYRDRGQYWAGGQNDSESYRA